MSYTIEIIARAGGGPTLHERHYVQSYTASGYDGRGQLVTTPYRERAKRYATHGDAVEAWRAVSRTHPTRRDGKPNRPLTAFTVAIEPIEP